MIYKNGTIQNKDFRENESGSTYTITGTLTNEDGVMSGFSASNYITTNCTVGANSDIVEIYGSYNTATDITTEQYVFCTSTRNLALSVLNSKFRFQICSNNGTSWGQLLIGSTTLVANTKYYFKVISDNTNIRFYILTNTGWVLQATGNISGTFTTTTLFGFGNHLPTKVCPTLGKTDIKDYTIKISNKIVWSGMDAVMTNGNAKVHKNYVASREFYEV